MPILIGLHHPLEGITNLRYKLLCFLTPNKKNSKRKALAFNWDRCCHLVLCLWLIHFHWTACFKNCKQLFEYQHLLQLRGIWWQKFFSIFKCSSFFSTPELIRHLWQLKTIVFLHWHLICAVLLKGLSTPQFCRPIL